MNIQTADPRLYELLAEAFAAEGVDTVFTLMGDGNMHWVTALADLPGMKVFHARHEHCACAMAIGYYSATGKPGVASTTCGPGFTQISTALSSAAKGRVPLVVFAGESPVNVMWHNQMIDQAPIAAAVGAHYIRAHSLKLMNEYVREAFFVARQERRPVVLGVPYDLQQQRMPRQPYLSSFSLLPRSLPTIPHDCEIAELAEKLGVAERPIILAGRGVMRADAERAVAELAEVSGALLATTLPGRGMFDDTGYSIGVSGGFASPIATEFFAHADFVLAIGAGLNHHTVDGGHLFSHAFVAQIDERPIGLVQGRKSADFMVRSDAKLATEALITKFKQSPRKGSGYRTPESAEKIKRIFADDTPFAIEPDTVDPRQAVEVLDAVIPKDWDIVSGSGHSSYFYTHMRNRRPENFHVIREFGAIGNAISIAIGVAATKGNGKVVLLEGDGALIMHLQELETIKRHGLRLLICALNDGGFGAEVHKLKADGVNEKNAQFGRPDFASIARGFGLRGSTVTDLSALPNLMVDYSAQSTAEVWNICVSENVVSPRMRNFNSRKH